MGKEAFLNLLLLQMRHQDPLNPLDNEAMLAQLAQFSTLEEMQSLNASFQADLAATESVNNAMATTLIGKEIKAIGDSFSFDGKSPATIEFLLPSSGSAQVQVLDENGTVVRTETVDGLDGGWNEYEWDGKDDSGHDAAPGTYRIKITQNTESGVLDATTFVTGRVTGVRFDGGVTYLLIGDRRVTLSEVLEINAASTE